MKAVYMRKRRRIKGVRKENGKNKGRRRGGDAYGGTEIRKKKRSEDKRRMEARW